MYLQYHEQWVVNYRETPKSIKLKNNGARSYELGKFLLLYNCSRSSTKISIYRPSSAFSSLHHLHDLLEQFYRCGLREDLALSVLCMVLPYDPLSLFLRHGSSVQEAQAIHDDSHGFDCHIHLSDRDHDRARLQRLSGHSLVIAHTPGIIISALLYYPCLI
jgi:hypothetical protein